MNDIILFLFGNIQLRFLETIAIGCTTLGLIGICFLITTKHNILLNKYQQTETPGADIVIISNKGVKQLNKKFNIIMFITIITLTIAMTMIFTYSYYNSLAIEYGAYGDGQKLQTLNEIYDCTIVRGFKDESEKLPNNLKGSIIIFYKYGCPDCREIHDEIITCIKENNVNNIYFVSSRSKKGTELLKTYPIKEVPTGIYIRIKESNVSDIYKEILYGHTYDEDNKEVVLFEKEKMMTLIEHQKNGD